MDENDTKLPDGLWLDDGYAILEINPGDNDIRVNLGSVSPYVYIDKLYGPIASEKIRVSVDKDYNWLVERENVETSEWEVKAKWNIQESFDKE